MNTPAAAPDPTLRDLFALLAPESARATFMVDVERANFPTDDAGGWSAYWSAVQAEQIAWRWRYADAMLAGRGK